MYSFIKDSKNMTHHTSLTRLQINELKTKAHHLNPVILVGQKGLSEAVIIETDNALTTHELIKVKIHALPRAERIELFKTLCTATHAELIQCLGNIAIIYRKNNDSK